MPGAAADTDPFSRLLEKLHQPGQETGLSRCEPHARHLRRLSELLHHQGNQEGLSFSSCHLSGTRVLPRYTMLSGSLADRRAWEGLWLRIGCADAPASRLGCASS